MDSRVNSKEKLVPPAPLPYVSRRALKRVLDVTPPPTECPKCGGPAKLVRHAEVYGGREYGDWPYLYVCHPCDMRVGLHNHTDLPLGVMADKETRWARKRNKSLFTQVLKLSKLSRKQLYAKLAHEMNIPAEQCHWALFTQAQAEKAGGICYEMLDMLEIRNAHAKSH